MPAAGAAVSKHVGPQSSTALTGTAERNLALIRRPAVGRSTWLLVPAVLIFLGVFVAPLLNFLVLSFWSVKARMMRPDFTLKNYIATWTDYYDTMASTMAVGAYATLMPNGLRAP